MQVRVTILVNLTNNTTGYSIELFQEVLGKNLWVKRALRVGKEE